MGEVDEKAGGNKKKETFQVNLPTSIKNERSSSGEIFTHTGCAKMEQERRL